jgi:hypothetical protein
MEDETFNSGKRFMIGTVTAGGSLSGLASAAWAVTQFGANPITWGVGAVGAAIYAGIVFKAETLSFQYTKTKSAVSAWWDFSAFTLGPPVVVSALVYTFGGL